MAQREELVDFKEVVVDLVIQAVDKLIDASSDQSSGSAAQLKDTFALRRVQTFPQPGERRSTLSLASRWSLGTSDTAHPMTPHTLHCTTGR